MNQIFEDILAVINFLKTFVYYSLYYSFRIGQCIVQAIRFVSNNLLQILNELFSILAVIFESFTIFCQDILQGLQQIVEFLFQIRDEFINGISTGVWSVNKFLQIITNGISEGYKHVQNSILNLGTLLIALCKLCKYIIVLFGSGVWFAITLVPYSLWNLLVLILYVLQSTPAIIFNVIIDTTKYIKDCAQDIYHFVTDVPIESVIGIVIAMCLAYTLTQFYITIFSYLYSKSRNMIVYVLNKFNLIPSMPQRNNRRPQLRRTYRKVKNEMTDERFCIICQEHIKCILVLPCRHVCMCSECYTRLQLYNNTCPICRNDIESTMKIFV